MRFTESVFETFNCGVEIDLIFLEIDPPHPTIATSSAPGCTSRISKYREPIKKLKYELRIIEFEKAFRSLISCTGGAGPSASKSIQRLTSRISYKKEDSVSDVITYRRTKLNFALLRSSILFLGGARCMHRRPVVEALIGTIVEEGFCAKCFIFF